MMYMSRSRTRSVLIVGLLLAAILAGFCLGAQGLRNVLLVYLAAWLFVMGAMMGSAAFLMIHALTGGEWGVRLGRAWIAAIRLFPWVAMFVLPLIAGAFELFPWLSSAAVAGDPYLADQRWYLNGTGLIVRTVAILVVWYWLLHDTDRAIVQRRHTALRAAIGLIIIVVTVSVEATDWVMSLTPSWHSTDIGLLLLTSDMLIALALAMIATLRTERVMPGMPWLKDVGNLMLVAVLGWAYISFMDYLTAWVADQPAETAWYLPRTTTVWWYVAMALMVIGLFVPFFALINGKAKRSVPVLRAIAWLILIAQGINLLWLVLPGERIIVPLWLCAPLVCVGLLGICGLRYRQLLSRRTKR